MPCGQIPKHQPGDMQESYEEFSPPRWWCYSLSLAFISYPFRRSHEPACESTFNHTSFVANLFSSIPITKKGSILNLCSFGLSLLSSSSLLPGMLGRLERKHKLKEAWSPRHCRYIFPWHCLDLQLHLDLHKPVRFRRPNQIVEIEASICRGILILGY